MTLEDVRKVLEATVLVGSETLDEIEIETCCSADLMSDFLACATTGCLLLTGLTNLQIVRTAEMSGAAAVCVVRGKRPSEETVDLATSQGLPLLVTDLCMFESCGRLFVEGVRNGCADRSC